MSSADTRRWQTNLAPFTNHKFGQWGKGDSSAPLHPARLGWNEPTNVGGPASSFGIWKDDLEKKVALRDYDLTVENPYHIGSGSDPKAWKKVAAMSLDLVRLSDRPYPELGRRYVFNE